MTPSPAPRLVGRETAERLLEKAAPLPEWNLTIEQFQITLERSAAQRFGGDAKAAMNAKLSAYFEGLHLHELALACACSAGNAAAWDHFVAKYRPELYHAARAIAGESSARELADSLYADLFGLRESEGHRKSLFDYFHGRSKLSTWLRAILAQRHVDEFRRARKTDSLDDAEPGEEAREPVAPNAPPDPERNRYLAMLQATLAAALGALEPRDRLRLAYYYVEELTLAQIGKLMGEHEATVSRKLDRARSNLRQSVERALVEKQRLSEAQLRLCFEYACKEWPFDLTRVLSARD